MKEENIKGITLVALVVTIVILLILSGIAISQLKGLITMVKQAKEESTKKQLLEEIDFAIMEEQIRAESGENLGNIFNYDNVWETLRKNDSNLSVTKIEEDNSYRLIYKGYKFKINGDKTVEIEKNQEQEDIQEKEYTIVYYKNDGTEEKIEQKIEKGKEQELDINKFVKNGYKIEGWYLNSECTGTKVTKATDNIKVYAKWTEKTTIDTIGSTTIGNVTYAESYEIWNKYQLEDFRTKVNNGKNFNECIIKQMDNIDLNSGKWTINSEGMCIFTDATSWTPIGNQNTSKPFSGTYEGNGKKIEGIYIYNSVIYQGLFGYVSGGSVQNLTVNGKIQGGSGTGGIVGLLENGKINNCINKSYVTNGTTCIYKPNDGRPLLYVGGVLGEIIGEASIQNLANNGIVEICATSSNSDTTIIYAGGVLGFVSEMEKNVEIKKCYNTALVGVSKLNHQINQAFVGGIAGVLWGGKVTECYNIGKICGIETTNILDYMTSGGIVGGGFVGNNNKIEKCWNSGYVENSMSGGIVGINQGYIIENCYNTGNIVSNYRYGANQKYSVVAGGICGWNGYIDGKGTITKCYNKGTIEGKGCNYPANESNIDSIGGICGCNSGASKIEKTYNVGVINCKPSSSDERGIVAGGISGMIGGNASIINSYNIGKFTSNGNSTVFIGGILGWNWSSKVSCNYIYNNGSFPSNVNYLGGLVGWWNSDSASWNNYYWLENSQTSIMAGNYPDFTGGKMSSSQIKSLISNSNLPSNEWKKSSNINNAYPYLSCFDDQTVWLRDNNINGGEPYLKENEPK